MSGDFPFGVTVLGESLDFSPHDSEVAESRESLSAPLSFSGIFEDLLADISSNGWRSLTRKFHPGDVQIFADSKVSALAPLIYVSSEIELEKFQNWLRTTVPLAAPVQVRILPSAGSATEFSSIPPGLLALEPDSLFLVPGGRFNEMYGWDSFFIGLGLLNDENPETSAGSFHLAESLLKNLTYQIECFGKVHNASRSYFLNRSSPPFLTSFVKEVLLKSETSGFVPDACLLRRAILAAAKELSKYWFSPDKTCPVTGLTLYGSRNFASLCLAVEPGHYDEIFERLARAREIDVKLLVNLVSRGLWPRADAEVWKLVEHDLAVRESGHDTTERLVDSAGDLVTADLNSL
jgi:alpha,alpha-trehalase